MVQSNKRKKKLEVKLFRNFSWSNFSYFAWLFPFNFIHNAIISNNRALKVEELRTEISNRLVALEKRIECEYSKYYFTITRKNCMWRNQGHISLKYGAAMGQNENYILSNWDFRSCVLGHLFVWVGATNPAKLYTWIATSGAVFQNQRASVWVCG